MARIQTFEWMPRERVSLHEPIDATYFAYERDDRKIFQIDTAGSKTRQLKGKVSQSIQLDEQSAAQLYKLLGRHFGFK